MSRIVFPPVEDPRASVVIVTYGGAPMALEALAALRENTRDVEVILVDNASPDGAGAVLEGSLEGVRVILHDRNAGFGAACNLGAAYARAPALLFLNPDAFVEPGWLEPLLARLEEEDVGAAAPRLLNLDGTLQEAGSVVGREGATWALGWGRRADDPSLAFPLDVDFASAACLLVRRSAFVEAGGFDVAYHPAYVEDVDLCLRLWDLGYRVVLEPRSSVRHVRSASSGRSAADAMIRRNRGVLLRRWAGRLAERSWLEEPFHFPHRIAAVRDHRSLDRILVVADTADEVSSLVSGLAVERPGARITLVLPAGERTGDLPERGIEVVVGPDDGWFEGRRYHASVVIEASNRFRELIAATQPQAPVLSITDLASDPGAALAGAGVAPPPRR